ncbi:hypothetical protein NQ317_014306 [Molorchus minor]|uniref:Lymphoid-specific helicase n=1 Tax=Molorchus minor TaxID=1323400 RepID=A0ABQ9JYL9_9CUCU|nr:hypothetical protein NQ317_014306 [Molorchus minor]
MAECLENLTNGCLSSNSSDQEHDEFEEKINNNSLLNNSEFGNIDEQVKLEVQALISNNILLNTENIDKQIKALELETRRRILKERRLEAKRLAEEESLRQRKEKALKGMKYILGISEKYSTFFKKKMFSNDAETKKTTPLRERNKLQPTLKDMKEVAVDVKSKNKKFAAAKYEDVSKYLKYFEGGSLRPYQLDGVTWMTVLFENGLNGILADEMGLGKTIQIIALICHLIERTIPGPFLIVAPLSTLPNWAAEFERFAPQLPVVVFHGSQLERISKYQLIKKKYTVGSMQTRPIVLCSYQMPLFEHNFLKQFVWQYIVIDEGHRIKNHKSKLSKMLRSLNSSNRLILTGTPLQNNITELWALLNFLLPHIFNNEETFTALLMVEDVQDENKLLEQEEKTSLISTIHRVLAPFMLRRMKKDVLDDMVPKKGKDDDDDDYEATKMEQPRKKRKCTMKKRFNFETDDDDFSDYEDYLLAEEEKETGMKLEKPIMPFLVRITMQNTMMMFKKIVNHPYLVHFPLDPLQEKKELLINEDLITSSGKMMVLDAMLPKLQKDGHKVLIFSTLCMTLDLIEEFLIMRNYKYRRLDGAYKLEQRGSSITDFNSDPDILAFLLSTRAGGLGLNLTGADTVIFFDRDWNPQVDIQAQDRCHRIGQTKPVVVYTLITKNTIDEKIISCGVNKRLLEKIVIKDGKFKMLNQVDRNKAENDLRELQQLLERDNQSNNGYIFFETRTR